MTRYAMLLLAAAAAATPALPAHAQRAPARVAAIKPPPQLTQAERQLYRDTFAAIRAGDWAGAEARLAAAPDGPLHAAARAELYLAKGSPKVDLDRIAPLLERASEMPRAAQLARLAETRGALAVAPLPVEQKLSWAGGQPRRARAKPVKGDPAAAGIEPDIQQAIKDDQPRTAEELLARHADNLTGDGLTELQQRIAWSYYLTGDDGAARRLALEAARRGSGEWTVHAEWVAALAAWRSGECDDAAASFASVAARSDDVELVAAGHYWTARAEMLCARPERVQTQLRSAARLRETFYGILAGTALGIKTVNFSGLHDYHDAEWRGIAGKPNVRAAIALAEIGEDALAGEFIRHQAKIGGAADHGPLLHLAADLDLASTQYWLAHNAPRGVDVNLAARYPMPEWKPARGWRIDPSLAFAHALQESNFKADAVSAADARGVMQVRPGTAGDIARKRGEPFERTQLLNPNINVEYGQTFIEYLRDYPGTGGLLPKVIAAYNAGPAPIARWDEQRMAGGDPLLYIESMPYWETRGYVPIVLRNYWIYEQKAGKASPSRGALAQGMWPRFPGLPGATAVRIEPRAPFAVASAQGGD